jgi:hypothetical protein
MPSRVAVPPPVRRSLKAPLPLCLLAVLLAVARVDAAGTDPTLALSSADATGNGEAVLVRLQGSLQFDDLLQFSFPAGVVLFQGTQFVRLPISGAPVQGSAALLAGGLAPTELSALLALGTPAPAPSRIVSLTPSAVSIILPPGFAAGAATAVLYTVLEGDAFLSNPITVTLP